MKRDLRHIASLLLLCNMFISCDNKSKNKEDLKGQVVNGYSNIGNDGGDLRNIGESLVMNAMIHSNPDYVPYASPIDSSFDKCNQTWRTNSEWANCIIEHRDKWEKLAGRYYDSLFVELDSNGRQKLVKYQENWRDQIKSEYDMFSYFEDNTSAFGQETHFVVMNAYMFKIRERAIELKTYLELIRENKELEADN